MRLELRHLQVICAIADNGSLTKAASDLGLAPSALTTQLQRIERSIGGPLFDRDRHGARPTALGDLMVNRARTLVPAINDLEDEAARLALNGGHAQWLRIGAVSNAMVGGLIRRITAEEPTVDVRVLPSSSPEELADMLAEGRVDFALIGVCGSAVPPDRHKVIWREVAVDAVFVVLPISHPLSGSHEIELGQLADAVWVACGPYKCCFDQCFAAACAEAGFTVRQLYELPSTAGLELVEAGTAVALCRSSFRPPPGLVTVPIAGAPLQWRHLLGWRAGGVSQADAEKLLEQARGAYRDALDRVPRNAQWIAQAAEFGITS